MKLSDRDKKVLSAAHLRAGHSVGELAKELNLKEHIVRDTLYKFADAGLIHPRTMVDVHLLGLSQYSVFFAAVHQSRKSQLALQRLILESKYTSDVFGLGGDFQYGVVLTVADISFVYNFLEELSRIDGVEIVDKTLAIRIATTLYRRRYLHSSGTRSHEFITYQKDKRCITVDDFDHRLLEALNRIPHRSLRELAQQLKVPHSTLISRYRRLEEQGIIIGSVYGMSCQALGSQAFRLLVYTRGFDFEARQVLHNYALKNVNVLCLFSMIGSWDYEFEIEVSEPKETFAIVQGIHEALKSRLITVKTIPILSFPKSSSYPFSMNFANQFEASYTQ